MRVDGKEPSLIGSEALVRSASEIHGRYAGAGRGGRLDSPPAIPSVKYLLEIDPRGEQRLVSLCGSDFYRPRPRRAACGVPDASRTIP